MVTELLRITRRVECESISEKFSSQILYRVGIFVANSDRMSSAYVIDVLSWIAKFLIGIAL